MKLTHHLGVPFNRPFSAGRELENLAKALQSGHLSGDGPFTKQCSAWLEQTTGCRKALLTHSGTAALDMSAILADIAPGDEVLMPSYTFVSTANAFVLRGGVPVFIDIRPDTFNLDESRIEEAITSRTRAIVPVHYAGVGCEMDAIMEIARRRNLLVIEDAAQGIMAKYKGRPLGAIGHLGALSFHETKNLLSGEGGALLINDDRFSDRAEVIREKGTNRSKFFRGQVDKYTWIDIGSSFLPSELTAAFLHAQFENADLIQRRRIGIWETYHAAFAELERLGKVRRPVVPPPHVTRNGHMYYLLLPNLEIRTRALGALKRRGVGAVFHYVPLHSSPAGRKYGRAHGPMTVTDEVSERLLRLPLWPGLEPSLDEVCAATVEAIRDSFG